MATPQLASQIFGEASTLCEPMVSSIHEVSMVNGLIEEPIYITLTAIFTLLYLLWLPHIIKGRNIKWTQIKHNIYHRKDTKREVISPQRIGGVAVTWILCISMILLFILRIYAQFTEFYALETQWANWVMSGVAIVAAMLLYGWSLLKIGGYLTLQEDFVNKILSFRGQMLFLSVVFLSPLLILCSFASFEQGETIIQLSLCMIIILIVVFVRETFLLFMRQNFSILHWILYLCAVEILPLTFIWTIAMRSYAVGV